MTTEPKTRTITLTDRPPVKIVEDQWPTIAEGSYFDHDGQVVQQANRKTKINIIVRRNVFPSSQTGEPVVGNRALVYGVYDYESHFQHERDETHRRGELLEGLPIGGADEIIAAIRRVRDDLIEALEDDERGDAGNIRAVAQECIASMPAEAI